MKIGPYNLKKGTLVTASLHSVHRNEKYFKNADKFIPERWTDEKYKE